MEEELGVPWEDVFASIEPEPLAAGTIGQVHRAVLDNGERVVVKVQRPTAAEDIGRDLSLLELFAKKTGNRDGAAQDRRPARRDRAPLRLAAARARLRARGPERRAAALGARPPSRGSTHRASTRSSRPAGCSCSRRSRACPCARSPQGPARGEAARQLLECYYRQILVEGFFHADPHPGNMLWADEKIFFLDFGMVGELSPEMRGQLLLLLLAFWQEDVPFLTEVVLIMAGPEAEDADAAGLEADLTHLLAALPAHVARRDLARPADAGDRAHLDPARRPAARAARADGQGARADAARRVPSSTRSSTRSRSSAAS